MENDMLQTILDAAMPHLLSLAGALLGLVLTWLFKRVNDLTGLQVEARHREALHSAIMTGLRQAAQGGRVTDPARIAQGAVDYAHRSVPDAIRRLRAPEDVLRQIAESRIGDVLGRR